MAQWPQRAGTAGTRYTTTPNASRERLGGRPCIRDSSDKPSGRGLDPLVAGVREAWGASEDRAKPSHRPPRATLAWGQATRFGHGLHPVSAARRGREKKSQVPRGGMCGCAQCGRERDRPPGNGPIFFSGTLSGVDMSRDCRICRRGWGGMAKWRLAKVTRIAKRGT